MPRSRHISLAALAVAALGCGGATEPPAAGSPIDDTVAQLAGGAVELGTLGGASSLAQDVDDHGVVVGVSETADGASHAFRWTAEGGMVDLGTLPGQVQSAAVRILTSGKILGWSGSGSGEVTPVIWTRSGEIVPLAIASIPGVDGMFPADFNPRGEVVGSAVDAEGFEHGWYWSARAGTVDLREEIPSCGENAAAAINASGLVAGTYCRPDVGWLHAFVWRLGRPHRDLGIVGDDPANANVAALGLADDGTVAGWIDPHGNSALGAYLWRRAAGFTLLPSLPGDFPFAYAQDVNERGIAVGASYHQAHDAIQPVAWTSAHRIVQLNPDDPSPGVATAVNQRGVVVGWVSGNGVPSARLWRLGHERTVTAAARAERGTGERRGAPP
ncbi:MAG TPA: hypothetical protein VNK43_08350, partial [Gemmatimonadales bacterium]|nr:hypothetical protein [Gemmatimonadales bacterium]